MVEGMGDKTTETETLNKEVKVKDTRVLRLSSKWIKKYIPSEIL
jgi:hypothetical protein